MAILWPTAPSSPHTLIRSTARRRENREKEKLETRNGGNLVNISRRSEEAELAGELR
jgi:hypothetical protein